MRFEKVSFEEYVKQYDEAFGDELEDIKKEYDAIKLPRRATTGSAGHDFFAPFPFKLSTDPTTGFPKEIKFGTGIKVVLDSNKVLMCYPRSGQGFKYKLQLYNTVGIIDSDYIYSKNEGHIFVKLVLDTDELVTLTINEGEGFMQGIVTQFFALDEEEVVKERNGGFGSTTKCNPLLDLVKEVKPYNTGGYVNVPIFKDIVRSGSVSSKDLQFGKTEHNRGEYVDTSEGFSSSLPKYSNATWLSPEQIKIFQDGFGALNRIDAEGVSKELIKIRELEIK